MNKRTIIITSITLAAALITGAVGLSLYHSRNQTSITRYDLYGDVSAAEGLSYQLRMQDMSVKFTADTANTIGGESSIAYASSNDGDEWACYGEYTFDITYGINSDCETLHTTGKNKSIDISDRPDYLQKIITDCAALTGNDKTAQFQIDLKDYTDQMPCQICWTNKYEYYFTSYMAEDDPEILTELKDAFALPLLDSYLINVTISKNSNGNLTDIKFQPLYESGPIAAHGTLVECADGSVSYVFYFGLSASEETMVYDPETGGYEQIYFDDFASWENTIAYLKDSGKSGIYTAQLSYGGVPADDTYSNKITLDEFTFTRLEDSPENMRYMEIDATDSGVYYAMYESEKEDGYLLQAIGEDGEIGRLEIDRAEIPTSPEDECFDPYIISMPEGICFVQGDGSLTVCGFDENRNLSALLTTKLINPYEEEVMLNQAFPDEVVVLEEDAMYHRPSYTWSFYCAAAYKNGKVAFITPADNVAYGSATPASVYATVYDADGLVYAGYFDNRYSTYQGSFISVLDEVYTDDQSLTVQW